MFFPYLTERIRGENQYHVLLDEVQLLGNFESLLNSPVRRENVDVSVTGSNAKNILGESEWMARLRTLWLTAACARFYHAGTEDCFSEIPVQETLHFRYHWQKQCQNKRNCFGNGHFWLFTES